MPRLVNPEVLTGWLSQSYKELKRWQIVTLAVVVLGTAWATYGFYSNTTSADQLVLSEGYQVVPVTYGNLVSQVSTNGSLTFPGRETLTFGSDGTVAKLIVNQGQRVTKGELLAELDQATLIALEGTVAQARIDLKDAQDSLTQLDLELALDLATAEESVASAKLQLKDALDALRDSKKPDTLLAQEQLVANARLELQNAKSDLINLRPNYAQQFGQALQTKANAEIALEDARRALEDYEPDRALRIAEARQAKANADSALDQAKNALQNYRDGNKQWLDSVLNQKETAELRLADSQKELDRMVKAQQTSQADFSQFIKQTEGYIKVRQETLQNLEALSAQYSDLEAQLEVAEEGSVKARKDLDQLLTSSGESDKLDLEAAVKIAEGDLDAAANALANLQIGLDPLEAALRQTKVDVAQASLNAAEEDLADMLAGADLLEVTLSEKQVEVAKIALAQAETTLVLLNEDQGQLQISLRESQVAAAEQGLKDALQRQDDAALKSPIDGLVTLVGVDEGDDVSANTTIVEVVDTSVIEINGIVDEVDILMVSEGVPTEVTLDAVPGQTFQGVVTEISPAASSQQGVVTYPITIQVTIPENMQLREGLTAVAKIVLNEENNVLLVPQQSLYGTFDQPTVRVMTKSGVQERPVQLGSSDDFWIAVRQGLNEGDRVVMEGAAITTTGSGFGQIRSITGGGRGGRRGP